MSKKSKHAKSVPFTLEVCNLIRHHTGEIAALLSQRETAFDDRDHAAEAIASATGDEAHELKIQHSDAVRRIDELQQAIRWHRDELQRVVSMADQPDLEGEYERPPEPPKAKAAPPAPPEDRTAPLPFAVPSAPEGIDEHLKAAVAELQLSDVITERLVRYGLRTIGAVAARIADGVELDTIGFSGPEAAEITKAVGAYAKKHRRAQIEIERDAEGGVAVVRAAAIKPGRKPRSDVKPKADKKPKAEKKPKAAKEPAHDEGAAC